MFRFIMGAWRPTAIVGDSVLEPCQFIKSLLIWKPGTNGLLGSLTPCDAYMHQWSNHHWLDNGLSPGRRQAIIWTNAGIFLIGPLGANFSEILINIQFTKMNLKISSAKWRPFCPGEDELKMVDQDSCSSKAHAQPGHIRLGPCICCLPNNITWSYFTYANSSLKL